MRGSEVINYMAIWVTMPRWFAVSLIVGTGMFCTAMGYLAGHR
jgi:hypothetical protein